MNKAEIITIGDEILIGQTVDTNSAWMGRELNNIGVEVNRIVSVSDRREEIISALTDSMGRADIILITGGLGPTSDDITKETLAEFFGCGLVLNSDVLKEVTERLNRRNLAMNEKNRSQAMVPEKCTVLMNRTGTAPGMLFEDSGRTVVSMPGVPHEMKHIMTEYVLPALCRKVAGKVILHRNIMTYGTFEARLAEMLEPFESQLPREIRLAYLPALGVIKLRLTARGDDEAAMNEILNDQVKKLYGIIPDIIYGENEVTLEESVGILLRSRNLSLALAESCTGGKIASMITAIPGSSEWFRGSVVAYANDVKRNVLGVREEIISQFGAVSRETAEAMAEGARSTLGSDYAVSVTGIAGPSGGTAGKPVGTVWIAVSSVQGTVSAKHNFADDRNANILRSSNAALNMLRKQIISY